MANEWFPHDYHARQDARVMQLLCTCSAQGYAAFWVCIECLHVNVTMHHDMLVFTVSKELGMSRKDADECVNVMIDVGLLKVQDGVVTSQRVLDNLGQRKDLAESKRKAAKKRWDKINAGAMHVHGAKDANAMPLHNSTEHNSTPLPPTGDVRAKTEIPTPTTEEERVEARLHVAKKFAPKVEDVYAYGQARGVPESELIDFWDWHETNGWTVEGKPVIKWQSRFDTWMRRKGVIR